MVSCVGTHRFSVYGMDSKEQSSYECWPDFSEDNSTELYVEVTHHCMEEHIHQMIAHGIQSMQHVVQPEGGHTKWTIRLVTSLNVHWSSPEVVPEEVCPGSRRNKIVVLFHC